MLIAGAAAWSRWLLLLVVLALTAGAVWLLGWWVAIGPVVLAPLLFVRLGPGWWIWLVRLSGGLGGVIGAVNAGQALAAVGHLPGYSARVGFGWAALLLALAAALAGLLAPARPRTAGVLMLLSGLAGVVAINLFFINTFYVLALLPWLIGVLLAFRRPD